VRQLQVPKLGPPPPPTSAAVSKSMKGNVRSGTKPELRLRQLLRDAGFPGYRLHWKQAPGTPDIAFPGRRVAIFVNGCFWHRCPHCHPATPWSHSDFWERKFTRNQERDARKIAELRAAGWTVTTVWECQLRDSTDDVVSCLRDVLLGKAVIHQA
jgi:DNA mismatch endonuclease Vsr